MSQKIKLADVPKVFLPFLRSNKDVTLWLNGNKVDQIFLFRESQFRINTDRGQFRYGLDTDLELEVV